MAGKKQSKRETTGLTTGPMTGLLTSRLFSFSIENEQSRTDDKQSANQKIQVNSFIKN